jgi:AcrR family transcriptional regulator
MSSQTTARRRARRSDGIRSRQAILEEAARLATVEGLDGLSLARLAEEVGMSKSGLYAHFGSKEELQLATVETAREIFEEIVVRPALKVNDGLERLRALAEGFLRHVEDAVFPGGCFFASAAAELDTRPGPVRDLALGVSEDWRALLEQAVSDAQAEGLLDRDIEAVQLAFEVNAYLLLANANFVANGSPETLAFARRAVADRLERELVQPGRGRPSGR